MRLPCVYTRRLSAEAAPLLLVYPLFGRERPGVLITVWRRRVEIRW